MYNKIKHILASESIFYSLLIALVAVTAYGLGKHSVAADPALTTSSNVTLKEIAVPANVTTAVQTESTIVASKNGSKYHYVWCSGAKQMKEENKRYFVSTDAARAAGYTPAANCDGLE